MGGGAVWLWVCRVAGGGLCTPRVSAGTVSALGLRGGARGVVRAALPSTGPF